MRYDDQSGRILVKQIKFESKRPKGPKDTRPVWIACLGKSPNLLESLRTVDKLNREQRMDARLLGPETAARILHEPGQILGFIKEPDPDRPSRRQVEIYFPTSAIRAYEAPGKPLGSEIVYTFGKGSRVVMTTGRFKGSRDIALSAIGIRPSDIQEKGQGVLFIDATASHIELFASGGFPSDSGRCKVDGRLVGTGGMLGEKEGVGDMQTWWYPYTDSQILLERNDGCFVGREVRAVEVVMPSTAYRGVSVFLNHSPEDPASVLAELSDEDASKAAKRPEAFRFI